MSQGVTGGVGNANNLTYYATIRVNVGEGLEFEALVGFTDAMDAVGFGLLGQ